MSDDKIDKLLELEKMRQNREVDLATLVHDIYKDKKPSNPGSDWLSYLLVGAAAVSATVGVVLAISPEARDAVGRLLGLGPKTMAPNPSSTSKAPIEPIILEANPTEPQSYRNPRPQMLLRPKFSHSGTSYDQESLQSRAENEALLVEADKARNEAVRISQKVAERPYMGKLTYGTCGGHKPYSPEELREIDERAKRRWG